MRSTSLNKLNNALKNSTTDQFVDCMTALMAPCIIGRIQVQIFKISDPCSLSNSAFKSLKKLWFVFGLPIEICKMDFIFKGESFKSFSYVVKSGMTQKWRNKFCTCLRIIFIPKSDIYTHLGLLRNFIQWLVKSNVIIFTLS